MSEQSRWQELLNGRVTRRGAIKAGTAAAAGVASVVITGGPELRSAHAAGVPAGVNGTGVIDPARLSSRDPHHLAGAWSLEQERLTQAQPATAPRVRVLPIDRAKFLVGQRFDLRVEAEGVDPATARIEVQIDNGGADQVLRATPDRTASKDTSMEVTWRNVAFSQAGRYRVAANVTDGTRTATRTVTFDVVAVQNGGERAKNVILFIGDGMGQAPITAARIISKGIVEGKYRGLLEMDQMEVFGHVTTSGMDSIATDSANSASAYATGHKSVVNAMGVYPDNTADPNDDPRVENVVEMLKRARGMATGLVTTADVTDATPAAFFAHTRRRSELQYIAAQSLTPERAPDVIMGGGHDKYLSQSTPNSTRKDDLDLVGQARGLGYAVATSRAEMKAAGRAQKILALFRPGHMNVYMDREVIRDSTTLGGRTGGGPTTLAGGPWNDQPTLWEMTEAAIGALEQNSNGFFLMVEGASIDKQEHPMDWQRAVWDTIEFDKAIGSAKRWAAGRGDTLIVITADHNHSMSVVGTHDRDKAKGRAGNGVYDAAGFPNFVDSDGDGFPDDPNPSRTLFIGFSNHPDHRDDFELDAPAPVEPALIDDATKSAVPNPERDPGAELQTGNLDPTQTNCVHTVDDVPVFASGPGARYFSGLLDNTEIFFGMVTALGLTLPVDTGAPAAAGATR